jgi:hypothetical protein
VVREDEYYAKSEHQIEKTQSHNSQGKYFGLRNLSISDNVTGQITLWDSKKRMKNE